MTQVNAVAAELVAATIEYHRARLAQLANDNKQTDRRTFEAYDYMCTVQGELNSLCVLEACE